MFLDVRIGLDEYASAFSRTWFRMTVLSGVRHSGNKLLGHLLPLLNGDRRSGRRDQIEPTPQTGSVSLETSLLPSTHRRANGASCDVRIRGIDQSHCVVSSSHVTSERCVCRSDISGAWNRKALVEMEIWIREDIRRAKAAPQASGAGEFQRKVVMARVMSHRGHRGGSWLPRSNVHTVYADRGDLVGRGDDLCLALCPGAHGARMEECVLDCSFRVRISHSRAH